MKEILQLQKNQVCQSKYCCWRSRPKFLILKIKNFRKGEKAQLNVTERLMENQNSDFRKKQGIKVSPNKNSKGLGSRQNTVPELQSLYSPLQVQDLPPKFFWLRKIAQEYSQIKEIQTWIMSLGEDQIFAQQKDAFKHNSNCKNQK